MCTLVALHEAIKLFGEFIKVSLEVTCELTECEKVFQLLFLFLHALQEMRRCRRGHVLYCVVVRRFFRGDSKVMLRT